MDSTTTTLGETRSSQTDGRAVLESYWQALEREDFDSLGEVIAADFIMEWPQSGERFVGFESAMSAMEAQDEKPIVTGEPWVIGEGEKWVTGVTVRYGDVPHQYIGVFDIHDGRIRRATEYFAAPFPAKEARAAFTDHGA